jgi:hypothetical protein
LRVQIKTAVPPIGTPFSSTSFNLP